ncbi:hypothetical protein [Streptomyces sp. NPDC046862]|uniref:hypothetical protein n=1 Tax=Streptomyces sp. NPDC046862 TaxID=3154603 RepID=UPI0034512FC6
MGARADRRPREGELPRCACPASGTTGDDRRVYVLALTGGTTLTRYDGDAVGHLA